MLRYRLTGTNEGLKTSLEGAWPAESDDTAGIGEVQKQYPQPAGTRPSGKTAVKAIACSHSGRGIRAKRYVRCWRQCANWSAKSVSRCPACAEVMLCMVASQSGVEVVMTVGWGTLPCHACLSEVDTVTGARVGRRGAHWRAGCRVRASRGRSNWALDRSAIGCRRCAGVLG